MKAKAVFVCQSCGAQSPKWMGRCPTCGEWNTLVEEIAEETAAPLSFAPAEAVLYKEIKDVAKPRTRLRIEEFNKVLGGGVVRGSLVLIGGEPGIGKSTLLLQVSRDFALDGGKVLYISGEESLEQMKLRGDRLGVLEGDLFLLAETDLDRILAQADKLRPQVLVLDSIQTVFSSKLSSSPGTISQVREVANQVFRFAKRNQISAFLIGHITKEGSLAGPKSLEHIVDVVLLFEGERDHSHRVLRALKNRFGPVSELAIFEMTGDGLQAIPNPSAFFLKERPKNEPGSAVVATIKGTRPLLVEIQALVSATLFTANPRRMTIGLDHYRTAMILAVIEKKLGYGFAGEDIYLNAAGGLTVEEPAADIGVALAAFSCLRNRPVPPGVAAFGEIGLSGEIRSVGQAVARVREAASLGFTTILCPSGNLAQLEKERILDMTVVGASNLKQALDLIF
jgi:DNA repair protein RadA/Sms